MCAPFLGNNGESSSEKTRKGRGVCPIQYNSRTFSCQRDVLCDDARIKYELLFGDG